MFCNHLDISSANRHDSTQSMLPRTAVSRSRVSPARTSAAWPRPSTRSRVRIVMTVFYFLS